MSTFGGGGAIPGVGVVVHARCTLSLQAFSIIHGVVLLGLVKGPHAHCAHVEVGTTGISVVPLGTAPRCPR